MQNLGSVFLSGETRGERRPLTPYRHRGQDIGRPPQRTVVAFQWFDLTLLRKTFESIPLLSLNHGIELSPFVAGRLGPKMSVSLSTSVVQENM